jgi:hypothetical protein
MTRRAAYESQHETRDGEHAVQLRLLPGRPSRPEWVLDERTRNIGRQGVAQAKEILRRRQPPGPATERRAS